MKFIDNHVCMFCKKCPDEDGWETTYDWNNCGFASGIMYHNEKDEEYWSMDIETRKRYARFVAVRYNGNNREYRDIQNPQKGIVFRTVDNGGGYNITRCPFFKLNYAKYIQSDEWKEKREERLFLDGYKCRFCGSAINLTVHHVTYKNIPNEDMTDLVSLCRTCHNKLHEIDNQRKKF